MTRRVRAALFAALISLLACRKAPPPPSMPPHTAAPLDVRLADTLDSIEGFRGGVLAVMPGVKRPELRTYGEKMLETHFARSSAIVAWRRKHFPKLPPSEPMKTPCDEDVLFGKSLPMNASDVQVIDAALLQSQCEVLFASTILKQTNDPELLAIAHEVVTSTGGEATTLLQWKRMWSGQR